MEEAQVLGHSWAEHYNLILVDGATLPTMWDHALPLLMQGKAFWEQYVDVGDIHQFILNGTFQLWLFSDGEDIVLAVLTELREYPKLKVFQILWAGGAKVAKVLDFLDYMELWARRQGVDKVEIVGRVGWLRVLRSKGYSYQSTLISKDISAIREH